MRILLSDGGMCGEKTSASRDQVCEALEPDPALPLAQGHVRYFDPSHLAVVEDVEWGGAPYVAAGNRRS